MKERPILFSGPMVQAILEGRKTQTRRILKPKCSVPTFYAYEPNDPYPYYIRRKDAVWDSFKTMADLAKKHSPYGTVGDRLWVRETWRTFERPKDGVDGIMFRADDHFQPIQNTREAADQWIIAHDNDKHVGQWRPSIFMRQWMSRIALEITNVRVERVQSISQADCLGEGCPETHWNELALSGEKSPWSWFSELWDQINSKKAPYETNPFVWAITFKRVDALEHKEAA